MSDQYDRDEAARLESEIGERQERLDALQSPMTPDEARKLAREDPDEFNSRWEAARKAGRNPIAAKGAKSDDDE